MTLGCPPSGLGRARLTVPHRDLVLPDVLERDEVIHHGFPADGVAGVRVSATVRTGVEGRY